MNDIYYSNKETTSMIATVSLNTANIFMSCVCYGEITPLRKYHEIRRASISQERN